jgi:hypothetical protein
MEHTEPEQRHPSTDIAERLAIVDRMAKMNLPVGTPAEMKAESVPAVNSTQLIP